MTTHSPDILGQDEDEAELWTWYTNAFEKRLDSVSYQGHRPGLRMGVDE